MKCSSGKSAGERVQYPEIDFGKHVTGADSSKEVSVQVIQSVFIAFLTILSVSACGERDEEKASQNRPAIPGY